MNGFQKPSRWYKRILLVCILLSPALQEVYSYVMVRNGFPPAHSFFYCEYFKIFQATDYRLAFDMA